MPKTPFSGVPAFVAQRIEHLTTDQKVGGSSPSKRTFDRSQDITTNPLLWPFETRVPDSKQRMKCTTTSNGTQCI